MGVNRDQQRSLDGSECSWKLQLFQGTYGDYGERWDGAGEGNRTLVISLEGCCSTIELHPQIQ